MSSVETSGFHAAKELKVQRTSWSRFSFKVPEDFMVLPNEHPVSGR